MKSVSTTYKQSMRSPLRGRSYARVSFSNIDATASSDGSWSSNGVVSYSEFATVDYEYDYHAFIANLELNAWTLDGNGVVLSSGQNDGFISNKMSDVNGDFSTPAVLTRQFTQPHSFPGLTFTFDTRRGEFPRSLTVDFYANGEVVETETVQVVNTQVQVSARAQNIDKIVITFGSHLPYRRPRVEYVLYGIERVFGNDELVEVKQSHDVDPLSRRLPNETMSFTILDYEHNYDPDNPFGIYAYVDEKSPVMVRFGYELPDGEIEWIKADKYLLDSKPVVKDNKATFKATGLIGSLSNLFYKSRVGNKNFYDMAEEILLDAHLELTPDGTNPWDIDPTLRNMYTTAVLPIDTHMNLLQLIAHACRCRLFTDDDNIIHIKPFGVTVVGIYTGSWSDNGHTWYSEWETVNKGNKVGNTYATLELNRWTLDGGEQVLVDEDDLTGRGYISSEITKSNGVFNTTPQFTRTFDVSHDLPVVAMKFDDILGEYPRQVTVKYYRGTTLLDTRTVTCDSYECTVSSPLAIDCTKIEVYFSGNLPYSRARVTKVYYRETDFVLDFTSIGQKTQEITKIDKLREVQVARYSYAQDANSTKLFEGMTTETRLHVEFSGLATNISISVTGGSLVSSTVYGRAADLVLSSGTKTVVITGNTLTENSVVISYPVSVNGEPDVEENPLITNEEMCNALGQHIISYLTMRNTYDSSYRGNPEMEVGDIIGLQTNYTDEMDALILLDEITFNGSLSGKMRVKGLI